MSTTTKKPSLSDRIEAIERFVEHDPGITVERGERPEEALLAEFDTLRETLANANGNGGNGNGRQVEPVSSLDEAAPLLRRPFTPQAVKFKVQATWPRDADPKNGGLIVAYIDARLVVERLNLVCPADWSDVDPPAGYEPTSGGLMWCRLTVLGATRGDVGEGTGKGLPSDALKRAAVKFGIGVSLYAVPKIRLDRGEYLKAKKSAQGPTLELTPNGDTHCRNLYAAWLDTHGRQAFGEPLDHGDVDDAAGDSEVDGEAPTPEANGSAPEAEQPEKQKEEDPAVVLSQLLAQEDELQGKRAEAVKAMKALGAGVPQQLRELLSATDERSLDALVKRASNAADKAATTNGGSK